MSTIYMFLDVETTGIPRQCDRGVVPLTREAAEEWPYVTEIAVMLVDASGRLLEEYDTLVHLPEGIEIPVQIQQKTGLTAALCYERGCAPKDAFAPIARMLTQYTPCVICAHNVDFDLPFLAVGLWRGGYDAATLLRPHSKWCVMRATTQWCAIPKPTAPGEFKFPSLRELFAKVTGGQVMPDATSHWAKADVMYTIYCTFQLVQRGILHLPTPS